MPGPVRKQQTGADVASKYLGVLALRSQKRILGQTGYAFCSVTV